VGLGRLAACYGLGFGVEELGVMTVFVVQTHHERAFSVHLPKDFDEFLAAFPAGGGAGLVGEAVEEGVPHPCRFEDALAALVYRPGGGLPIGLNAEARLTREIDAACDH